MRVFISWSGETSKAIAEVLKQWLPAVIQAVRPYYSPDDVAKGSRWNDEIAKVLAESRVGLICVTPGNLEAPWVMFEAGALSKNLDKSKVTPILFGVEPTDVTGPLVQFQAARFDKGDVKKVIRGINAELGDQKLANDVLDTVFEMWWPKLEEQVQAVLGSAKAPQGGVRPQRELLEEVLMLVRSQARMRPAGTVNPRAVQDLTTGYVQLVEVAVELGIARAFGDILENLSKPIRHFAAGSRYSVSGREAQPLVERVDEAMALLAKSAESSSDDDDDDLPF